MDKLQQSTGLGAIQGSPQKKWQEQTAEEKVESLRNRLLDNRYLVSRIAKLENDIRLMQDHQHGTDGAVMVKHKDIRENFGGSVMTFDALA